MLTSVGRFLRKLRIGKGEILKDMATRLNVSSAFLSAVENGKKKLPAAWYPILQKDYELSAVQMDELRQSVLESGDVVELNIKNATDSNRRLAVSFARQFDSLDEDTIKKLFELLEKE